MQLKGKSLVGFNTPNGATEIFYGINPATGERLQPPFYEATAADIDHAVELAKSAFRIYNKVAGPARAAFLRAVAANVESLGEALVERTVTETGLTAERVISERTRTCNQLRMFSELVAGERWIDARIDLPDKDRKPTAKPDVRSMLRPLGPVAVFGASNFPLAFSVAGGDTASALAAGNPVIMKGHPAHPGTSEMVGQSILAAVRAYGLPEGTFSLVLGGEAVGSRLVQHPMIKAVAFTGSRTAGLSLATLVNQRSQPIPFFAEMSSVNPLFVLPTALQEWGEQIATGLYRSVTLGAGQFCTKPGIVFLQSGPAGDAFASMLAKLFRAAIPSVLLTPAIHSRYRSDIKERARLLTATGCDEVCGGRGLSAVNVLFETDGDTFLRRDSLHTEVFGPTTLLVRYSSPRQLMSIAGGLEGQLTASIYACHQDLAEHAELLALLETTVGRIVMNDFPTGVEVGHAMVHGGPYPATFDGRSTSVGTRAIARFTRPVCFQNFPQEGLPPELRDQNPSRIWRMVDGRLTTDSI